MNRSMQTVGAWRAFNKGRTILILSGSWQGEETHFVDMVNNDETVPADNEKPTVYLRMKVRTRFNTFLLLKPGEFMMVDKKIVQRPNKN